MERQIEQELEKYTILPEFRELALEILNQSHDKEVEERSQIYQMRHKAVIDTQKQLDNLLRMKCKELVCF